MRKRGGSLLTYTQVTLDFLFNTPYSSILPYQRPPPIIFERYIFGKVHNLAWFKASSRKSNSQQIRTSFFHPR
jgi:hypothetical protein